MFGIKLTRGHSPAARLRQRYALAHLVAPWFLCSLLALALRARADGLAVQCLCPDVRAKGDNGDLLLTCPIPGRGVARVVARIKAPCGPGGVLRAYYDSAGRLTWLTCNTTADPRIFPPTPPRAVYNVQSRTMTPVRGAVPGERCS